MPLPGSHREPQFLQEIKEPKHEQSVQKAEPVVETLVEINGDNDMASLVAKAESLGVEVKPNWGTSQLKMAIRLNS